MRWRTALAVTIATSWLAYSFLPLKSEPLRFAIAGLAFALVSRALPVAADSVVATHTLIDYRLRRGVLQSAASQAASVKERQRESVTNRVEVVQQERRAING